MPLGTSSSPQLVRNDESATDALSLQEALVAATSPATLMHALFSHDFEDAVFALKAGLEQASIPLVPAKIAFQMYKDVAEANEDRKKLTKLWEKLSKPLKKLSQETIIPMMFLVNIGRRLKARHVTVDGIPAGVFLMQCLWPEIGTKALFALERSAGDAVSELLIEHYDEFPDELPQILQAVNYRFESGSRCNLMGLMTTKKSGGNGRSGGSSGTSGS